MTFLYSLSRLLAYFNSGAEDNIYYLSEEIFDSPDSEVTWLEDDDYIKGEINKYIRLDISKAYARAWHIRDLTLYHQKDLGLIEHFTPSLIDKITDSYSNMSSDSIKTQRINHHLKLHFISYDKQSVSFTDIDSERSIIVGSTSDYDTLHFSSSYDIVMTLDDGRWRIRQMRQE